MFRTILSVIALTSARRASFSALARLASIVARDQSRSRIGNLTGAGNTSLLTSASKLSGDIPQ
jgi:hypothetical protein